MKNDIHAILNICIAKGYEFKFEPYINGIDITNTATYCSRIGIVCLGWENEKENIKNLKKLLEELPTLKYKK